ncbi:MAG: TonB-dependent receptor [Bacteroidia bacterium]
MKKKIYIFLCSLLPVFAFAQSAVKVKVTDAQNNAALPGANVVVKGTTNGASANADGMLTIQAKPNDSLEVHMIGYETLTVAINNKTEITVALKSSATQLTDVVVTGTRSPGRVKTETPVPVDVINIKQVSSSTSRMDLTSLLNYAAPSLNYNKQSGADGADHVDLATLRGLGPDQTLVLINGKRRHQTAFVALFGTRGRGNSGTDLNTIPVSSIDHVEILRDGASAQYGSDAIAGVINIVLKKNVKEFSGDIGYAGYYDKDFNPAFKSDFGQYVHDNKFDGGGFSFNGNYGVPVGRHDGFVNFSVNLLNQEKTYRQVSDTSDLFNNDAALPIDIYRRANGDGSVKTGGAFVNAEFPCSNSKTTVYTFGGYNYGESDAFAFTRNFSARPDRFPIDANGNLIFVDGIMQTTPDGETYFNPHIQSHISDGSFAAGVKGKMNNNWNWDISNNVGRNDFHFYGDKTFNASLGADQTHFDDGGFSFLQNTSNLNVSKQISGIAEGFNLAGGLEYRYEMYKLYAGEEASYANYDVTGNQATGSQGFPGYQPSDEVNANRSTVGGYIDAELDVTKKFLITGAVRAENYSDFGFTSNYKMSARYKVADNFSLRASGSTGFRAPSLQQINFSSTFTTVQGGIVAEVKIAPNYSPITQAAGIPELKQEKALNAGAGFTYSPIKNFNITIDGYWVQVKDRVVLSGQFDGTDQTLDPEFLSALNSFNAAYAQFFANAVNTTNKGVDAVVEYKKVMEKNSFRVTLAGNYQKMTIDKINVPAKLNDTEQHQQTFLSDREQAFILASAPEMKGALSLEYGINKLTIGARFTYFGKVTLLGYGEDALGINPQVPTDLDGSVYVPDRYPYNGKLVSDVYVSYKICNHASISIGADNVFNVHPDYGAVLSAKGWAYNTETGGAWDAVQMGSNGMRLFTRLSFNF